jgi:deoxycytidine triphosphate deaminase
LGDIEEKVGGKKIQDKAKHIRAQIANSHAVKTKLQKQVMNENGLIATLDAAKILAKAKVEEKEKDVERKQAVVKSDVEKLKNDMSSAEKQLDEEQEVELQDEKEARSKILEAVKHNQNAIAKAKGFLTSIEEGIQQFHKDIEQIPLDL